MTRAATIFGCFLGGLAFAEHLAVLLWGAALPLRHLTDTPPDEPVTLYIAWASVLYAGSSLVAASATFRTLRRHGRPRAAFATLTAMLAALPLAILSLLLVFEVLPPDPELAYLALPIGLPCVLLPYWVAERVARRGGGQGSESGFRDTSDSDSRD